MISDVLFDAVSAIREYQQRMPHVYGDVEKHINLVVAGMDWLQFELDRLVIDAETDADVDLEVLRNEETTDDHRTV